MSIMNICRVTESTWKSKDISLRQPCRQLTSEDLTSTWIKPLLSDMYETLYSTPSGIGLAAPQVGIQLKIAVIDLRRDAKKPLVLINPTYIGIGEQVKQSTESCLSVPGVVGSVLRYESVLIKYYDPNGIYNEKTCNGFEAIAVQHEIDHLNGIVYIDQLIEGTTVEPAENYFYKLATKAIDKAYQQNERN